MTENSAIRVAGGPSWATWAARTLVRRLSVDNPFYVLSALLFCLGLWTSFGHQARAEDVWALMFGLAGYTLLLAVPACLLVRLGGVWEDVRTVLLLVVLMFLATSVTFDATLARDPNLGIACFVVGLLFAVSVSEGVLRVMRLRLPGAFRVPYYLALALFFLYPIALSPLLDRPRGEALQWGLFGFSAAAGLVALALVPAARRGANYVRENGSPWRWPLYPWSLFGLLGIAVVGRSFFLCWSMQHVESAVPERLIFGPYFLLPFVLAVGVLLLEGGRAARSRGALAAALGVPPILIILAAVGHRADDVYLDFLELFRARLGGTPLYLALVGAAGFYAYAALRRVPGAIGGLSAALAILAVVGPNTLDLHQLEPPRAWPMVLLAALQLALGLHRRDAWRCLAAAGCVVLAVLVTPPNGAAGPSLRGPIAFHVTLVGVLVIGAAFDNWLGRRLRTVGAGLGLLASAAALRADVSPGAFPPWVVSIYPIAMASMLGLYGMLLRHRPAFAAGAIAAACWVATLGWESYRALRHVVVGLDAIAAGLILLLLAELISLAKAGLLTRRGGISERHSTRA
jgi:hypothetical protein